MIPLAAIRKTGLTHSSRSFGEDAEYFLRLALAGVGFRYLPEPLYLYRIQPGSATANAKAEQMRECIESCAALKGWSIDVQQAFQRKIQALRHNETLYAMSKHLRKGDFFSAIRQVVSDPAVVVILPFRLWRHFSYQLHRLYHGGASRNSGGR